MVSLLLDDDEMERKCEHACIVLPRSVGLFYRLSAVRCNRLPVMLTFFLSFFLFVFVDFMLRIVDEASEIV